MKIWLVNPFDSLPGESFRPGRYAFLAQLLAGSGHQVTWWTSNFFHMTKSFRKPFADRPNLKIIQLKTPAYKRNIGLKRILNHFIYALKFERKALDAAPPDIIITSCPPLGSAAKAVKVAGKLGVKCVVDIQDLWPESFEMFFPAALAKLVLTPLKKYADQIYRSADAVTAVSKTYLRRAAVISSNSAGSLVSHLGIDIKLFDASSANNGFGEKRPGEFWATYAGTIGNCYDIGTILDVADALQFSHSNIRFFIAGAGPELAKWKNSAQNRNLANCDFPGLLEYADMAKLLRQSDVGLNTFVKNAKNSFPNKVFDYMAAGLPMINSLPGELEILLAHEAAGLRYEPGDTNSLKQALLKLHDDPRQCSVFGKNARRLVEARFDKNREYPKYEKFLRQVAGTPKSN